MTKQPRKLKRVPIKEELVALTRDFIKALALQQFLFWSERVDDFDAFIIEEKTRNPEVEIELHHGWIYKSAKDLHRELMFGKSLSSATVRRRISELVEDGFLGERNNPNNNWDRMLQYRPNILFIQTELQKLGYALDGYPLVLTNNAFCTVQKGSFTVQNDILHSEEAITETTTKDKEKKKHIPNPIPIHNNQIHHTDLLGQPGVHYQNEDGKPVEAIVWKVMPKTVALTVIATGEQKTRVKPEGNLFYRNGDTKLLPVVTGKEKEGVKLTDDEREMKDTLMDIIRPPGNFVALTEKQASDIQKAAINAVRKKIASPTKFKRYQTWWTEHNWKGRGGEPITLKNMGDHWLSFDKWDNGGQNEIVSTIPKEILELGKAQKKQLAERNG